jgi:hypothetical protein
MALSLTLFMNDLSLRAELFYKTTCILTSVPFGKSDPAESGSYPSGVVSNLTAPSSHWIAP